MLNDKCETCNGEGEIEIGPICGMPASYCCGGCYQYEKCEECEGTGEQLYEK